MTGTSPIAVFILTGFLGSGKTTLLNRLIREENFRDSAIIVNEFGAIGLDHRLIATGSDNIVLLGSGCLCCVLVDSFRETLADLYRRRATGSVPPFARVLVETSGLADPLPLLQTIMQDGVVAPLFEVGGVIAVVDAVHGDAQVGEHVEARAQIAVADRLVLSKSELTSAGAVAQLVERLRRINPSADIAVLSQAGGPVGDLFRIDRFGRIAPVAGHHHHSEDIAGECFAIPAPVSWAGIAAWTGHLRERFGDDLLRCKALLPLVGQGTALVQGVRRLFEIRRADEFAVAATGGSAICIGRGLERASLAEGLAWLEAPDGVAIHPTAAPPPWSAKWEWK